VGAFGAHHLVSRSRRYQVLMILRSRWPSGLRCVQTHSPVVTVKHEDSFPMSILPPCGPSRVEFHSPRNVFLGEWVGGATACLQCSGQPGEIACQGAPRLA
jgi:hypothetical protein